MECKNLAPFEGITCSMVFIGACLGEYYELQGLLRAIVGV